MIQPQTLSYISNLDIHDMDIYYINMLD